MDYALGSYKNKINFVFNSCSNQAIGIVIRYTTLNVHRHHDSHVNLNDDNGTCKTYLNLTFFVAISFIASSMLVFLNT